MRTVLLKILPICLLFLFPFEVVRAQYAPERVYIGEKMCRECHNMPGSRDQFTPWRLSKHARAYSSLFKPEAKEIAVLSGINIEPQNSPICLGCHTTAYNVEEWERDDTFHFEDGVQCELCHGPGSEYSSMEIMSDSVRSAAAGLTKPNERYCLICHKEKNSHVTVLNSRKFDFNQFKSEISHPGLGAKETSSMMHTGVTAKKGFSGAYACAQCHNDPKTGQIFSKWHQSDHALAYAHLAGERAEQIATEMHITGPAQESELCLGCHATGQSRSGEGLDPALGVQCESCHGPAESHLKSKTAHTKGLNDPGLNPVSEATCLNCHQNGIHGSVFDFEGMLSVINHTKWPEPEAVVQYKTPFNLAVTRDGKRLYAACEASNSVIIVDPVKDKIISEISVGVQPHFVALSPDESRVYISNRGSDNVSVIDTRSGRLISSIEVGDEPHEMVIIGKTMYLANAGTGDVSVIDLVQEREIKRLAASRGPWGVANSPDNQKIFITNNLPRFGAFRTTSVSEITVIDARTSTVSKRISIPDANLIQGIAVAPDNAFALVTLVRSKNLVPMTRNIQGWIITNGIGLIWPDGRVDQLLLDEVNDFFADPTDVVFSRDGRYAFVTGGGVHEVAMIDIEALKKLLASADPATRKNDLPHHLGISPSYIVKRIGVGLGPRGMVVSPDNRYLYVADGLDDDISVIDIDKRTRVRTISLGGPEQITEARFGERIFHSAEYTFARQFSCHSCHPDGSVDGLSYDIEPDGLGYNPVDNRTLRGINDTAPFKWTGKNPTLKRQCGPRLAAFFTRTNPFAPEESAALDRYIVTIPRSPNRYRKGDDLTDAQRRGKRIFERIYDNSGNVIPEEKRCHKCHTYPYFTNRELFDVGTASELDTDGIFDVPHLNNIYETPPYMHDGRASSLDEIWTVYNPEDTHGITNDLTKDQLNDLIEFLKTL